MNTYHPWGELENPLPRKSSGVSVTGVIWNANGRRPARRSTSRTSARRTAEELATISPQITRGFETSMCAYP